MPGASGLHSPAYRRLCGLLRRWREDAGLTQRALAARLGKPPSYVHKCETAERRVDAIEFIAWCESCDRDPPESLAEVRREVAGRAGRR